MKKKMLILLTEEELAMMKDQPCDTIKRVRNRVNCTLREAKRAVDQARVEAGIPLTYGWSIFGLLA